MAVVAGDVRDVGVEKCRSYGALASTEVVTDSELLRDSSLSQHRVSRVPGQDFPIHREPPLRDRTVPDFHDPLDLDGPSSIHGRGESPSRSGCNSSPSEGQDASILVLVQDMKPRRLIAEDSVQLPQLRDQGPQFLCQNIRRIGFSDKTGDIVAFSDPNASLAVPLCANLIDAMRGRCCHNS